MRLTTDPDHPAFPEPNVGCHPGLTKRERFALAEHAALLANPDKAQVHPLRLAKEAVDHADMLISALNERSA